MRYFCLFCGCFNVIEWILKQFSNEGVGCKNKFVSLIYASHNTIEASFSYTKIPVWNYVLQTENMNKVQLYKNCLRLFLVNQRYETFFFALNVIFVRLK